MPRYPYWHAKPKTEKLYCSSKFTVFEFSVFSCEKLRKQEAGPIFSVVSDLSSQKRQKKLLKDKIKPSFSAILLPLLGHLLLSPFAAKLLY